MIVFRFLCLAALPLIGWYELHTADDDIGILLTWGWPAAYVPPLGIVLALLLSFLLQRPSEATPRRRPLLSLFALLLCVGLAGGFARHAAPVVTGGIDWAALVDVLPSDPSLLATLPFALLLAGALVSLSHRPPGADSTSHGSAGWAARKDIRPWLVPATAPLAPGSLVLAASGRARRLVLPPELAQLHALLVGGSGSGKTRGLFMPNAALATGSFVCTDPKGELWATTSGYHAAAWRFAPREPDATRGFNWIPLCRDEHVARQLAAAAMQLDAESHTDQFWKLSELALCAGLFAHAALSDAPTPMTVYHLLQVPPSDLVNELAGSPALLARGAAARLAELKAETHAGIVLGVANKLAFLDDPTIRRFVSAERAAPDFRQLLRLPTAVYWVLHEQDVALLQPLSAVFFTLLLTQLSRGPDGKRPGGRDAGTPGDAAEGEPVPVTLLLDEFANIGRIPNFATTISVARGRKIAIVLGVQDLAQLDGLYGKHAADTIRTNCATKIGLHGLTWESARLFSQALGSTTVRQETRTRQPKGLLATTTSYSEHYASRPLLTDDEVRRIGREEMLVIITNVRPIRAVKRFWDAAPRAAPISPLSDAGASPDPPLGGAAPRRSLHLDERNEGDEQ